MGGKGDVVVDGTGLPAVCDGIAPDIVANIPERQAVITHGGFRVIGPDIIITGTVGVEVAVQAYGGVDGTDFLEIHDPLKSVTRNGIDFVFLGRSADKLLPGTVGGLYRRLGACLVADGHHPACRIQRIYPVGRRDGQALYVGRAGVAVAETLIVLFQQVSVNCLVVERHQRNFVACDVGVDAEFRLVVLLPAQCGIVFYAARLHVECPVHHVVGACRGRKDVDVHIAWHGVQNGESRLLHRHAPACPHSQ